MRTITKSLIGLLALASTSTVAAEEISIIVFKGGEAVPGVAVVLDGQPLGRTGLDGAVAGELGEGSHALRLTEPGGEPSDFTFDTAAGENVEIGVRLGRTAEFAVTRYTDAEAELATGELNGTVVDSATGAPIAGAEIVVEGTDVSVLADAEGNYALTLPRGEYALVVTHPAYAERRLRRQRVVAGMQLAAVVSLAEPGQEGAIEEVVAVASYISDTPVEVERRAGSVLDVISAEDISIAGDSNAAAALRRVTGLTVSNDDLVYVRGLGERYSQTLMNGAELPSPDPTRRVIPLDLFPTGVLSDVQIQKSYSPKFPGDFSGGVVTLGTRGIPDAFIGEFGASLGGNSETTGGTGFTYEGGGRDWSGYDDGTRAIPTTAWQLTQGGTINFNALSDADRTAVALSLANNYNYQFTEMPADFGFDFNIGDRWDTDSFSHGVRFALLYGNGWRYRAEDRTVFSVSGGSVVPQASTVLERSVNTIQLGSMFNYSIEFGNADRIDATTLLSRQTTDSVFLEQGDIASDDRDIIDWELEWVETQLLSQQFKGTHLFDAGGGIGLDWHLTLASADREEPDTRQVRYARNRPPGGGALPDFQLAALSSLGRNPLRRTWEFLNDDTTDGGVDLTFPFRSGAVEWDLHTGIQTIARERDFRVISWRFDLPSPAPAHLEPLLTDVPEVNLAPANIGPGQWEIFNGNLLSDSYRANHDIDSLYLMADAWFTPSLRAEFGARYEDSQIEVITSLLTQQGNATVVSLDDQDVLPAVNLTWLRSDEQQLRIGLSQTVNRPQFRELSDVPFTDPETRYVRQGNPNLVSASILNFDLRWEHYWSGTEGYSVAFFYKDFSDPIEQVIVGGGPNGTGVRSFDNAASARNIGVEAEYRQGFDRWFTEGFMSHTYLSTNVAFIDSSVEIDPADAGVVTSLERELQGQSPWVFNATWGYQHPGYQIDAALLLNVFGERIVDVGQKGIPDSLEQPAPVLDFAITKGFGDRWSLTGKVRNILDPSYEVLQGDGVERAYERGVSFSISADYTF